MDVTKKNIAVIITSLRGGGAERVASLLINKYIHNYNIHLFFTDSVSIEYEIPNNVLLNKLYFNFKHNNLLNILFIPIYGIKFFRYLKEHDINIVLSFLSRPNFIACFTRILGFKGRIVISERANMIKWFLPGTIMGTIAKFLYKWLYPKADFVVPNSMLTAHNMKLSWKLNLNYRTIYNPIQIERIQHQMLYKEKLPGNPGSFKCIMVSRFDYPKDQTTLINAAEILKNENIDLFFVGKGKGLEAAKELVKNKGLENKVFFIGFHPEPFKYIYGADAFVFSSTFEGFPNALIEAMACAVPVISADCQSGPREILAPDTDFTRINDSEIEFAKFGIIVPVKNEILFAKAILELKRSTALQTKYSHASEIRARDFESEKIIEKFSELLFNPKTLLQN